MKICFMNSFFEPLVKGGADVQTQRLARGLSKHHEVIFIATSPYLGWSSINGKVEEKGSIKLVSFFPLNLYHGHHFRHKPVWLRALWHIINIWNPHSYAVVRGIMKQEKPDLVHSFTIRSLSPSVVSAIDSLGIPHIHTLYNYELLSPWGNLIRRGSIIEKPGMLDMPYLRMNRFFIKKVKAATAETQFVLDLHAKYGFFKKARKYIIPGSLAISDSHYSSKNKDYKTLDILFVGQVSKHKGVHILLDAFTALDEPNVRLHVVGQGPLAQQVSNLAYRDTRIRYHGYVPQGEHLWELYSKANLLAVPSMWFEPFGGVSIEAFYFGTPVIGSAIGGIPEIVEDGHNGLLFKPGDVDDLSQTLKKALSDIELLKKLGENAKKSAQKYNLDSHIDSLLKVYEGVLK